MIRKVFVFLTLVLLVIPVLMSASTQPGNNIFRDRQGRFTVGVPQGWTATAMDENTVQIAAPPAYVTILAFQTTASGQAIVSQLLAQVGSQWQGLEQVREDQVRLSGQPAYAVVYKGTNPRGVASALRIVGMSSGNSGYALMFSVPVDQFDALKPALDGIERSFSVGQGGGVPAVPVQGVAPPVQRPPSQTMAQIPKGGIPAVPLKAGFCTAVAPADWKITGVMPDGKGLSMWNGTFGGVYTIEGLTAEYIQYGKPVCADPRACVQSKVADSFQYAGKGPIVQMSQIQQYGDMFVQEFESTVQHSVAMYSVYPMSLGGYVLVFRMASGPKELWPAYGTIAILAAGSIRCQAQYRPSPGMDLSPGNRGADSTYNVQLGTEYAHDPETGETFYMKHADDWMETGPDGPGYYRQVPGGGYRKLTPGLPQ
jgi:hypothetical protein